MPETTVGPMSQPKGSTPAGTPAAPLTAATLAAEGERPRVQVGVGPEAIRVLIAAVDGRVLPQTYVTDGQVVELSAVSGAVTAAAGDADSPLPVTAAAVSPASLAGLLAEHTHTFRRRARRADSGEPETYEEETTPPRDVLAAVLARRYWPGLPPLFGVVGAPVLRPDGTLLQQAGYDPATGTYLATKVPLAAVPDRPSTVQVAQARAFLLDRFLVDFPWVAPADRANYLGLLVTPVLRPFLRCLTPFGIVDATMPASGKTILTAAVGMLYGQRVLSWTSSDEELRKAITSVLADQVGVVVFDNIAEGSVIDSPILARLITERTWTDRRLGTNTATAQPNDRLWLATGNNLRVGGDMASRTVLIRLDPRMPRPEERTGFAIPNLEQWILTPANQRQLLRHLLVLVLDWTSAGAPRARVRPMRQFTNWAEAIAGFLAYHQVPGFLANAAEVREIDEEDTGWTAFLHKWHTLYGRRPLTTAELRKAAEPVSLGAGVTDDRWDGLFLSADDGRLPSAKSVGRRLTGQIGRYHGLYVLRSVTDPHDKMRRWWVEEYTDEH